jgi:hypothetical protein
LTHNVFKAGVIFFVFSAWTLALLSLPALAEEINYDVPLIGQKNDTACWAASLQMILSYFKKKSFDQEDIAKAVGFSLETSHDWEEIQDAIEYWEFCVNPTACNTPEGWRELLRDRGPLWVVQRTGDEITHAIVLKGMSDDNENPKMYINDPWPPGKGEKVEMTYEEFEKVYEAVEEEQPGYLIQIVYYCGEKTDKPGETLITDFKIPYDVPLVAQDTTNSCKATGRLTHLFASFLSWQKGQAGATRICNSSGPKGRIK